MGINSDKTGTGKTASMVALILRDRMPWDTTTRYTTKRYQTYAGGRVNRQWLTHYEKIPTTLVLVNQSIVSQWMNELSKSPLNCIAVTSKKHLNLSPEMYDVIVITPSMYNGYVTRHIGVAWKRFIFDEPGHLFVPSMKEIVAGFYWFVTATPECIVRMHRNRRTSFMRNLFGDVVYFDIDFIFGPAVVKNDPEFIRQSFLLPTTHHINHKCYVPLYRTLNGLVNDRITEMVSAGNIEGVIKLLGGGETKNVTELVKQKKLTELKEIDHRIGYYRDVNIDEEKELFWQQRKNRLQQQIDELDKRFDDILNSECSICYDKLTNPVLEPGCQNVFCGECLIRWLRSKNVCPLCRDTVDTKNLVYINQAQEKKTESKEEKKEMNKEETIQHIINNKKNGKFLIFSNWSESFNTIHRCLQEKKISYAEVKGAIKTRERIINSFKNGELNVIFLNAKYNGAGINLQEATDIIVYHDMSPTTLNQILGRANRIGRKESLTVHHLIV
jgi:SNF2 family DNA or RNA helicase